MTAPKTKFGAYEILHELKSGGMGSVLLGRRRGPGTFEQLVAIKTIRTEYASAESVRAMFLDEAAILARLGHPAVATVHDFGEEGSALYMVMEYVAGIPFRDFGEMQPPPLVIARAVAEACRGLHAAHELRDLHGTPLGLVHRDVSPDNILLGFDGHVKVIDFGIALVKNRQAPVTEFGTVKGKPPYMSPEQVKNEALDRRSDVFSLGVVLWEMLTGQTLFDGDSIYAIAMAVEKMEIPRPSSIAGPLPDGLDAVVMAALARDLSARIPSASAFAEQLEQVISSGGEITLEAWAEKELRAGREGHRRWLSGVVGGLPSVASMGRATGSVTQLAVIPEELVPADSAARRPTELAATLDPPDDLELPPRRRAGVVIGIVIVVAIVIAIVLATSTRHESTPPVDAPSHVALVTPDAAALDAPTPSIDAAVVEPADAFVAIDAPPPPVDAAVHHIAPPPADAAVPPVPKPDAAPAPSGTGSLKIIAPGKTYAQISIDGGGSIPTPQIGLSIPAGTHIIRYFDPRDGSVFATKTITVHDGDSITVTP